MCNEIIAVSPDLVFTEKGVSDLAQHFLVKAGITAIRRLKKTDNNRLARVSGATIVNDTQHLREEDVGVNADLFEIKKIGDEYYAYVTSEKTTAVTVVVRGPSKDIINEVERNLQDALSVARNVMITPRLAPGGGALEMALAQVRFSFHSCFSCIKQKHIVAMPQLCVHVPICMCMCMDVFSFSGNLFQNSK
ncbi:unnamed protein product [Gongylonema pulchrum]|uniref:T-complex protein 1 subunit theta n=1 Tax=Gongylonema pulchrum TaxID=637853 RepID=A0A183D8D4_9BILA|nr:unnamed protein product [Gongylonema pulchrum]